MMFRSDYWLCPKRDAVIVTNGCRVNLDRLARVLAARKLMEHNQEGAA